ncbi:hypothetical protein RHOSPDRAFT_5013, partial [Rhodotorula sp. JG-1b]
LVVLQVVSRLFSFALNQLLLRSTSPHAFGVATIQLDTLIATVLFFVREGLRGAVANNTETAALRRQTLLIPTLLTPAALLACAGFYAFCSPSTSASAPPPQWSSTIFLYSLSVLIELVSEPLYLETLAAWQILTTKRVKVEGGRYFDQAVLETGWALTKQSVVKQLLTEGDKLAVGKFGSEAEMGGFTTPLLHLLLGPRWSRASTAPLILRAYAYSLPFMGMNGITEAFFQAVASPRWIQRGAGWMVVCAGAFAATCWFTVQVGGMGAKGLIVANCVNMVLRTAFSTYFMVRYFSNA